MKLGIIGDCLFIDYGFVKRAILGLFDIEVIDTIVCGETEGVGALAVRFADDFNSKKDIKKLDKKESVREVRSILYQEIVDSSDHLILFPEKNSGEALIIVQKALKANKEIFTVGSGGITHINKFVSDYIKAGWGYRKRDKK
ncbi:MAG: hypothetical protein FWC06_09215 [Treponema sp.]|nr:hypothetical protein [Treponema sp.]